MKERTLQFRVMAKAVMIGLLLGVAGKAYAYDFSAVCETGQKLYYNIIDATNCYVMLTSPYYDQGWSGYTKPTGVIVLPESVQNNGVKYSVVAIGSHAFWLCNGLIGSLTIPSSIVEIGYMAFSGCSGFTGTLTIPNSVTSIDSWAFENCSGLTGSLIIPNSVTSIRGSAFRNCNGLETIEVEVGNPIYDSRENCNAVIMTSTNELVLGCKNTVILNSITAIGS